MAEFKGIDVSEVQGNSINWKQVSKNIDFAILRIHQRYGIDGCFERNYKECLANNIKIGVYKYSYALTEQQAIEEAQSVLSVLNSRKLDFPIFYDLEWSNQRSLGKAAITKIAKAFLSRIKDAGYTPAIYCNVDWYNNVLDTSTLNYDYWLAAYPFNDNGTIQERLRPSVGVGWQYSSKGNVLGINGNVDMNVFYKDYSASSNTDKKKDEVNKVNQQKLVMDKAISYLGTKENPPGSNNVIFNTDYYGGPVNGSWYPWCCAYVWDIYRMVGLSHLFYNGQKTAYCPTVYNWAKQNGLIVPKTSAQFGDIVLFDWGGDGVADHIGFIESYSNGVYTTIEGNTSDGNDSNGGIVMRRTRYASSIQAIVRPKYTSSAPSVAEEAKWKATGTATATVDNLYFRATPNGVILGELMKGNRFEVDGVTQGQWTHAKVANMGVGYIYTAYIKHDNSTSSTPASSTTIANKQDKNQRLFVGKVTADKLNVRTWAGTGNPCIRSYPQLSRGNLVDVMNFTQSGPDGSKWYYVRIAGKYFGFVHSQYIQKQ